MASAAVGADGRSRSDTVFYPPPCSRCPRSPLTPGLGTFAVSRDWRLYVDPAMLDTARGGPSQCRAVLCSQGRTCCARAPGARRCGERPGGSHDVERRRRRRNQRRSARSGVGLPEGAMTHPAGSAARTVVPLGNLHRHPGASRHPAPPLMTATAARLRLQVRCQGTLVNAARYRDRPGQQHRSLSAAAADLVRTTLSPARSSSTPARKGGAGQYPAGLTRSGCRRHPGPARWCHGPKVRAAVRPRGRDRAGQVHHFTSAGQSAPFESAAHLPCGHQNRRRSDHRHLSVDGRGRLAAALSGDTGRLATLHQTSVRVLCCDAQAPPPARCAPFGTCSKLRGGGG